MTSLSFDILTDPAPLQVSGTGQNEQSTGTVYVVISNRTDKPVNWYSIELEIPHGGGDGDLTADPDKISYAIDREYRRRFGGQVVSGFETRNPRNPDTSLLTLSVSFTAGQFPVGEYMVVRFHGFPVSSKEGLVLLTARQDLVTGGPFESPLALQKLAPKVPRNFRPEKSLVDDGTAVVLEWDGPDSLAYQVQGPDGSVEPVAPRAGGGSWKWKPQQGKEPKRDATYTLIATSPTGQQPGYFLTTTVHLASPEFENVTVDGNLLVKGRTDAKGELNVAGNTALGGGLAVDGETEARGAVRARQDVRIFGKLEVDGQTDAKGVLYVGGDAVVGGNLDVIGAATVQGAVRAGQDVKVEGGLTVTGPTEAKGELHVGGNTALAGELVVTGRTEAKGELAVGRDVAVGGGLTVRGRTSAEGDLHVGGDSDLDGSLTVRGHLRPLQNLEVGGNLVVAGSTEAKGAVRADQNVTVSGGLEVGGPTELKGVLGVGGDATVGGGLTVSGDLRPLRKLEVGSDLTVLGRTYAQGELHAASNAVVEGALVVAGVLRPMGDLEVAGAVVARDLTARDKLTTVSTNFALIVQGASQFTGKMNANGLLSVRSERAWIMHVNEGQVSVQGDLRVHGAVHGNS
ncbi:hypothetical protein [Streptomyces sp. NPDC094049]|uniref:hypothetical protein n=1 Tax=Streptomyces sp. NPDC094049 TaxID=3154987 RepID=UPI003332C2E6